MSAPKALLAPEPEFSAPEQGRGFLRLHVARCSERGIFETPDAAIADVAEV